MDSRYSSRGISPPRITTKRYIDPRASTGTVISSAFDAHYYPPQHRGSLDPSRLPDLGYEAQPIKKKTYVDSGYGGSTTSRTEYAVRPRERKESLPSENRRPFSTILLPATPSRNTRPIITTNFDPRESYDSRSHRDRAGSPVSRSARPREDTAMYLSPVQTAPPRNHQRHHSATPADTDRLTVARRDRHGRDRADPRYHGAREARQSGYLVASSRAPIRIAEEDVSYTGPREQFDRDYPQRRSRDNSYTRAERPVSTMGPLEWKPVRERKDPRENGPPPSASRQLDRLDRPDHSRRLGHESDSDRDAMKRRSSTRNPVVHQTKYEEYDNRHVSKHNRDRFEDDGRPTRDRDHEKVDRSVESRHVPRSREGSPTEPKRVPRSRESSPEPKSGIRAGLAAVGLGGLAAAAGLAGARHKDSRDKVEESDSDRRKERRRRKNRQSGLEEENDTLEKHDQRNGKELPEERASSKVDDVEEDSHKHRRLRRRKHRHRDRNIEERASESSSDRPVQPSTREETTLSGVEESDTSDSESRPRETSVEVLPTGLEQRTISPGEDEDDRPRRVALVEPPKDEERPKPKGILKQRTVPFPEDPNPAREGVAPLGRDGLPPDARWTKINRILVNPEALEQSKERFEEREDYVIVLRVLTKEEIQKLAEKTREIRVNRELQRQEEVMKKRPQERHRSREEHSSGEDDEDDPRKPPLAIEPPHAPVAEPWLPQNQQAREPMGRTISENSIPGISGFSFPETYSTNV